LKPALPLQHYPLARSTSLEETAHIQSSVNNAVKAEQLDRRAGFHWEANRIQVGRMGIMATRYGAGIRARSQGAT